ncbi:MAG: cytochrome P450-dit2 [Alyxoria varia]|nr:MAG: cytochrome P450-dit2 [Alyxoria varia]
MLLSLLWLIAALCVIAILRLFRNVIFPPSNFPKDIPTIPFYVTLLPLVTDMDQLELYDRYLARPMQEHGAVKVFFAGQWNILVGRASMLQEVFKYEDIYAKSGNQRKIPNSVLAEYTGDNIISAHGSDWKLYSNVMKPGLLKTFPIDSLVDNTKTLVGLFTSSLVIAGSSVSNENAESSLTTQKTDPVLVGPILQRYSLANLSKTLLGTDFHTLEDPSSPFHNLQTSMKLQIFRPTYMAFPFLDRLSNYIPSRRLARKLVRRFDSSLLSAIRSTHANSKLDTLDEASSLGPSSPVLARRLIAARNSGLMTEKQFRDNLAITYIAGHENPQILMITLLYLLGKHTNVQQALRQEICATGMDFPPDHETLGKMELPILTSTVYEALRMFPPLSQIINRKTTAPVILGGDASSSGIKIAPSTYVGYHNLSTGRDPHTWGTDYSTFRPSRWGTTTIEINAKLRTAQSKAEFPAFHGGRRACLGQRFALLEMKVMLWGLVREVQWDLGSDVGRQRWTGAGPMVPVGLKCRFWRVQGEMEAETDG